MVPVDLEIFAKSVSFGGACGLRKISLIRSSRAGLVSLAILCACGGHSTRLHTCTDFKNSFELSRND